MSFSIHGDALKAPARSFFKKFHRVKYVGRCLVSLPRNENRDRRLSLGCRTTNLSAGNFQRVVTLNLYGSLVAAIFAVGFIRSNFPRTARRFPLLFAIFFDFQYLFSGDRRSTSASRRKNVNSDVFSAEEIPLIVRLMAAKIFRRRNMG